MGSNYFRIHPKGVGLVCAREGGLPALTFVEEYLGEVHTPWRWFEMQVGPSTRSPISAFKHIKARMHTTHGEPGNATCTASAR